MLSFTARVVFPELIHRYGLFAVFLGTFLEGETILIIAGALAHNGMLPLPGVIGSAIAGSLLGDQLFFWLGHRHGPGVLERHPEWHQKVERARRAIGRGQVPFAIGFRFIYGLRTVSPFALGLFRMHWRLFAICNAVGAVLWAVAIGVLGYFFGHAFSAFYEKTQSLERWIVLVLLVAIGLVAVVSHARHRARTT